MPSICVADVAISDTVLSICAAGGKINLNQANSNKSQTNCWGHLYYTKGWNSCKRTSNTKGLKDSNCSGYATIYWRLWWIWRWAMCVGSGSSRSFPWGAWAGDRRALAWAGQRQWGRWTCLALTTYPCSLLGTPGGGPSRLPERTVSYWDPGIVLCPALACTHFHRLPPHTHPVISAPPLKKAKCSGLRPASRLNNGPENKMIRSNTMPGVNTCKRMQVLNLIEAV